MCGELLASPASPRPLPGLLHAAEGKSGIYSFSQKSGLILFLKCNTKRVQNITIHELVHPI